MGLFKGAAKAALLAKVIDIVRVQAAKPENQQRVKDLIQKAQQRKGATRKGY